MEAQTGRSGPLNPYLNDIGPHYLMGAQIGRFYLRNPYLNDIEPMILKSQVGFFVKCLT